MKLANLRDNRCPKCGSLINASLLDSAYYCTNDICDFVMTEEELNIALAKLYKTTPRKKKPEEEDNSEDLNNLGHEIVAEDFSDSPYADRT